MNGKLEFTDNACTIIIIKHICRAHFRRMPQMHYYLDNLHKIYNIKQRPHYKVLITKTTFFAIAIILFELCTRTVIDIQLGTGTVVLILLF